MQRRLVYSLFILLLCSLVKCGKSSQNNFGESSLEEKQFKEIEDGDLFERDFEFELSESENSPTDEAQKNFNLNKNTLKIKNNPDDPASQADKIIEYIIFICLALSGLYVSLAGFKAFRFTMVILGFYVSYYVILFIVSSARVYDGNNIGHQLALFFGSLVIGFIISVLCYMLDRINFIIFGAAVSSMVCLFIVQFFLDLNENDHQIIFLIVFLSGTILFAIVSFFVLDHFIIFGTAFVGAMIAPINVGFILSHIKPFENRQSDEHTEPKKVLVYFLACGILFITGLITQYYLRHRILKKWRDEGEEEISRATFLEDKF